MKKVRWGIVGPGRIAHTFAEDSVFASNAVLQAVSSRSLEKAQAFASEYNIPNAYGSYAELLSDPEVDAIYIATPHTLHVGQSMQAINAGKSVLCEKPFTVTPSECEKVIAMAANSTVTVVEALWTYFLPAIQHAKKWVDEGRIGKLVQIKADFGFPIPYDKFDRTYDKRLAGGCLLDMGIYPISLAYLFTRMAPTRVDATASFAPNGVEDDISMLFSYEHCAASLSSSFKAVLPNAAYLIGDKAMIQIPNFWSASECSLLESGEVIDYFNDQRQGSGFEFQIQSVSEDILMGRKESTIVPLKTSMELQKHMALVRAKI